MTLTLTASVPLGDDILTADALDLVERLEREFGRAGGAARGARGARRRSTPASGRRSGPRPTPTSG